MNLPERIEDVLQRADISPRVLSLLSKVHFTTIYLLLRRKENASPSPLVESALTSSLDSLETLIASGFLPIQRLITSDKKAELIQDKLNQG